MLIPASPDVSTVVLQIKYGLLQLREQLQIYTGFPFNPPPEAVEPNRGAKVM